MVKAALELLQQRRQLSTNTGGDRQHADIMYTTNCAEYEAALRYRAALLTPAVYEGRRHLRQVRADLVERVTKVHELAVAAYGSDGEAGGKFTGTTGAGKLLLGRLDEFVVSPTFYYVYQGYHDKHTLRLLQEAYSHSYPDLGRNHLLPSPPPDMPFAGATTSSSGNMVINIGRDNQTKTQGERKLRVGFVSLTLDGTVSASCIVE